MSNIISIHLKARPQKEEILLRWAPSTSFAWAETNKSGFWVDRYTVMRDGAILSEAEYMRLTESPIKALSLDAWGDLIAVNDYAAIVIQALYREDFTLSTLSPSSGCKFNLHGESNLELINISGISKNKYI